MAAGMTLADEEAIEAVKAFWDAEDTLQRPFGLLTSGWSKSSPVHSGQSPATLKLPYATIDSTQGPSPQQYYAPVQSRAPYQDYRHITIWGWGSRADMVGMAKALAARLTWLPRDGRTLGNFPPGVNFVRIMPLDDPHLSEDETTKEGKDVWKLTAEYELWTTRHIP